MNSIRKNSLANETSSYLLSHANQKINWFPWGAEAFEQAQNEDKLLFISIGYSASHWCKKMSRDCFENESIVELLNTFFIPILVDREEHPDLDKFYLDAVLLISDKGGWPINCFALPNGAPIWGGTGFEADALIDAMLNIEQGYRRTPQKVQEASKELMDMLSKEDCILEKRAITKFTIQDQRLIIEPWRRKFDTIHGGTRSTPKFPLPNAILFLLQAGYYFDDEDLYQHCFTTLRAIARGSIRDQLTGAFFRYTFDNAWRLPSYEIMLQDNACLLSVYAIAKRFPLAISDPPFEAVIKEEIDTLECEMTDSNGMYYSSMKADDGNEGQYYKWKSADILPCLECDSQLAVDYYGINMQWMDQGMNAIYIDSTIKELSEKYQLPEIQTEKRIAAIKERMRQERDKNNKKPEADKKIITAYNANMMRGLYEAYITLGDKKYLDRAAQMADYIMEHLIHDNYSVARLKTDSSEQTGFLDDYAYLINIFCTLHHALNKAVYLEKALGMTQYVLDHFYDSVSGMFFYAEESVDTPTIMRTMDLIDRVSPSSNSVMAMNLTLLAACTGNSTYRELALQMLSNTKPHMSGSGPYIAYWARVSLLYTFEPIMAFTTNNSKLAELTAKCSAPNLYFCQATDYCLENRGKSKNGWFYYQLDLSGSDEENQKEYARLMEYVHANKLKGVLAPSLH